MKMRRPWQPHMSNDQLFNPFVPPQERERLMTVDHLDIVEEEEQDEDGVPAEGSAEQKNNETPRG